MVLAGKTPSPIMSKRAGEMPAARIPTAMPSGTRSPEPPDCGLPEGLKVLGG